jgi:hypothetical protein
LYWFRARDHGHGQQDQSCGLSGSAEVELLMSRSVVTEPHLSDSFNSYLLFLTFICHFLYSGTLGHWEWRKKHKTMGGRRIRRRTNTRLCVRILGCDAGHLLSPHFSIFCFLPSYSNASLSISSHCPSLIFVISVNWFSEILHPFCPP